MPPSNISATRPAKSAETWLEDHGDCLYAYALARVRSADTAEELVQETLLAGIAEASSFAGRSTVRTWLVGILKNKILQHYRRRSRETASRALDLPEPAVEMQFDQSGKWQTGPAAWGRHPAGMPEGEEFREVLRGCLAKLPGRLAESFLLAELQGMGTRALSETLGVSTNHLYVMLYRARTALRRCLERHFFEKRGTPATKGC